MFGSSNLGNLLAGGTRRHELSETRQAWDEVQARWQACPFAHTSYFDLVVPMLKDAAAAAGRAPAAPIVGAAGVALEALLRGENVGDLEVNWEVIETDAAEAIEFRKLIGRRRRWSADFEKVYGAFRRITTAGMTAFFEALPESCFGDLATGRGDTFEVPILDLLDDPASIIERLVMLPYDDETFRLDIFYHLRDLCASNLLVASGFLRNDNIHERSAKLVLPTKQKNKTGAELSDLYLAGSPLKELLDVTVPFRIPETGRFEHCHIVGGTGHGKTQLMQKMIHADLMASVEDGRSVVVIDSQGDLINKLVRLDLFRPDAPDTLADRLVIIDPADVEYPAALNLFDAHQERTEGYSAADRERVLNGVVELFETFFGEFLGAELTQKQGVVFKYLARLMLAIPNATIHTLMQIMEDGRPFKPYMEQLDGSARYFFETEFFHPAFAPTKKQVLRRLWGVLSTPAFERMFTQPKNKLDLFQAMNEGKIILISTAKDFLKREGSQLFGRFFIAMLTQAALERSILPERLRSPVFVYVDEAQEYFDDNVETILSQARKYMLGFTAAHQTLDQLSPRLRSAMFSNTSMKCAGGVSAKDARSLADELRTTPEFIEGMRRRGPRTEFAVWVKHLTGQAIRLSVPLGFLESQPTLETEEYEELLSRNRTAYCGTLADIPTWTPPVRAPEESKKPQPAPVVSVETPTKSDPVLAPINLPISAVQVPTTVPAPPVVEEPPVSARTKLAEERASDSGKGGREHRYLQALAKQLAEQAGLRATIEAPLPDGNGQVDILLERDGVVAAIEVSVSTPVSWEQANLRKCLLAGYPRIAVVLAKSKRTQANYKMSLSQGLAS
ncbi:MAG: DUF87 domain-containing protein, partial [Acidobacteria bacterium]|nr:DUF87 domain-containing protein [Acidobacteriota bacterium]